MKVDIKHNGVVIEVEHTPLMVITHAEALELRRILNHNYRALRPAKNWSQCPFELHSDDCDCNGAGGDR